MSTIEQIQPGEQRTVLVFAPHADDGSIFAGGTLALMSDAGWRVVMVRVTNDALDSFGVSREETIRQNTEQMHDAMRHLGVTEFVELGYETDVLGDVSEVELRERVIRLYRLYRPYAVMSFDPFGMFHENNQDHFKVAYAVDEAFWTAMFDKHHPEHLVEGLMPHGVFERWYFARRLVEVSTAIDISSVLERKIAAVAGHELCMRNMVQQLVLQARTGDLALPALESALEGPLEPLIDHLVRSGSAATGERHGVPYAEEFRVVRFSGLQASLEAYQQHHSGGA
ncbi:MAG: PIG-L deacetylase family protein [Gaiellaceae bacterium]